MSRIKTLLRNINYLMKHSLWDQREEDIVYLTNKILDDGIYEYGLTETRDCLKILSKTESLNMIKNSPRSFVRTGDGEIKLMLGMDQPFQRYEKEIDDILRKLLKEPREDIYVGINRGYFQALDNKSDDEKRYYRRMAYEWRKFYKANCNKKSVYIDAAFTSCDLEQNGTNEADIYYEEIKKIFENKKLAIVSGIGILEKLENDIFENAECVIKIDAPRINAWDEHTRIIQEINKKVPKNYVIIFILGMAGKAMIPQLTDQGYMCWDVGHLAKYYDENKKKTVFTKEERANFFAPD